MKEKTLRPKVEVEEEVLDRIALGMAKDSNGHWNLVTVKYNLETGNAVVENRENHHTDRMLVVERFKIEAANKLMSEENNR